MLFRSRNGEWEAFERDGSLLMSGKYRDGKIIGIEHISKEINNYREHISFYMSQI